MFHLFWLPSLMLVIDWAQNRREIPWLFVLICLGPLGSLAYVLYFWESITFPFPIASTLRSLGPGKGRRRCSRCQKMVDRLEAFEDARTVHFMCSLCRSELEIGRRL